MSERVSVCVCVLSPVSTELWKSNNEKSTLFKKRQAPITYHSEETLMVFDGEFGCMVLSCKCVFVCFCECVLYFFVTQYVCDGCVCVCVFMSMHMLCGLVSGGSMVRLNE